MTPIIVENFLGLEHLRSLQDMVGVSGSLTDGRVPLFYNNKSVPYNIEGPANYKYKELNAEFGLVGETGSTGGHFGHLFFEDFRVHSGFHDTIIIPILEIIGVRSLIRAKLNVNVHEEGSEHTGWHVDGDEHPGYFTGLLYLTTNEGTGTLLEDGSFIEAIENRFAYFPGSTLHTGVFGKNIKGLRVAINLNFTM